MRVGSQHVMIYSRTMQRWIKLQRHASAHSARFTPRQARAMAADGLQRMFALLITTVDTLIAELEKTDARR